MKKGVLAVFALAVLLSINLAFALEPCQSGGLSASVHKEYQMAYTDEDFIQLDNKALFKDLEQLKDLTCLQYLDATELGVKGDIANLKNLENLEVLSFYGNPDVYGDICSLKGAKKLRSLKFAFDPKVYGDISCLKDLNLETFAMTYTNITGDLSDLSHMTKMKAVYLSGTGISGDVSSFGKLTAIEELGLSDEYPGNPNIVGDLASLDSLTKLRKVSLYSTRATNCEYFTKMHPNIPSGGCTKDSLKTLRVHNIRAEKKIGKDRYYGPPPDYSNLPTAPSDKPVVDSEAPYDSKQEVSQVPVVKENAFARLLGWFKKAIFKKGSKGVGKDNADAGRSNVNDKRPQLGPGGCRSQAECDVVCSKPEYKEACSRFAPPGQGINGLEANRPRPISGPGGCRTQAECDAFCSKPENSEACSKFVPPAGIPDSEKRQPQGEKGWCQTEEECDALIKQQELDKQRLLEVSPAE